MDSNTTNGHTPVWVRDGDQWRPGEWVRTIERGPRKGFYVVVLGYKRKERVVSPDCCRPRHEKN